MPRNACWPFERQESEGSSSYLHQQLGTMQGHVNDLQMELEAVKKDRLELLNRKQANVESEELLKTTEHTQAFSEISRLKSELLRIKNVADQERFQKEKYEEKLRDLELKLNELTLEKNKSQETRRFGIEDTSALKSQLREMREELEEINICLNEKNEQLQEYRVKYLQAEQNSEELRRQLEAIEYDNKQVSDQIHIEIQKMKMQFQEKLHELSPLPDLLKGAQMQLQEAKQLQRLAEDSSQQLSHELQRIKEKLVLTVNTLNKEKADNMRLFEDNKALKSSLEEKQIELTETQKEAEELKTKVMRIEERLKQTDQRYEEKNSECGQLVRELGELREESNRSITRSRERSESVRRCLKTQVSEMERQLVQSRAQCRAYQKERDEVRQRIGLQLTSLQENYELLENRYRGLIEQVSVMKKSHTYMLAECCDVGIDFEKTITS